MDMLACFWRVSCCMVEIDSRNSVRWVSIPGFLLVLRMYGDVSDMERAAAMPATRSVQRCQRYGLCGDVSEELARRWGVRELRRWMRKRCT
jgi:hypothetical protein